MSAQGIRTHPDGILYRPSRAVEESDRESGLVAQIAADLRDTAQALEERTGLRALGLAAPQIGYSLRVFWIAQWPSVFINPTLEYVVGKTVYDDESCFSLPELTLLVGRAARVRIRYEDERGRERAAKMRDRDARIAQHEFDHLDGVTIVQRADRGGEGLL